MSSRLTFFGAAGTVTGSRHVLETRGRRLLIDCGLFQGSKDLRQRNWEPFPVDPKSIDGVLLTHAHIDHTGYLPRLCLDGFEGEVRCTDATADLARILLPDTGHLQEEEAKWANKKGYSKHQPALPLFTLRDAEQSLQRLRPVAYGHHFEAAPGVRGKFRDSGHILGAGFLDLKAEDRPDQPKIVFGGDLGRPFDYVLRPPAQAYNVDYLVLESTYGDRLHDPIDPSERLARVIRESVERGGVLVIPSFAVGRAQTLLFVLRELQEAGRIPTIPIYLDSPMALEALEVHRRHISDCNLRVRMLDLEGRQPFRPKELNLVATPQQSKAINAVKTPAIIISASGMVTGGRILHHLKERLPHPENTVLFIGYQAEGTRGRKILEKCQSIRMFGEDIPVRAHIANIPGFSGHADYLETLAWLMGFNRRPRRVFIVHGEPASSLALAARITERFGWEVTIPRHGQSFELDL